MSETDNRLNLELHGFITTVTEFANSPPGATRKSGDDNLRLLPAMPVHRGGGNVDENVPFIPSTAIRGALRRAAAEVALSRFSGGRVNFEEWKLFAVGGVKESDKDGKCPPDRRHEYINGNADHGGNPLVALFGAGKPDRKGELGGMVGGKLHIAHAVPGSGVRAEERPGAREHLDKSPRLVEVLNDEGMGDVLKYQKNFVSGGRKKKAKQPADSDGETETESGKVSIGMPLAGYEVLPRGLEIPHQMTLAAVTPVQFGFFLSALERFAADPVIGAHRSHGCGRIRAEYAVYLRNDEGVRELKGEIQFGAELPVKDEKKRWPKTLGPFFSADADVKELGSSDWTATVSAEQLRPYRTDASEKSGKGS